MMTKKLNGGNNKSSKKSTKSEIFRAAVGLYLKHKCYVGSDKFRKSDFLLAQNRKQFVFQKMLEADMHCGNCFQYSNVLCLTNNHQIVDQQFSRFSHFVESQSDVIRTELRRFYGPMLCHLYIELVKAREPKAAVEFLKKHAHLVAPVESYETPPMPTKINGCSVSNDGHADATTPVAHQSKICFAREALTSEDPEMEYFMKLIQTLSICTKLEAAESDPEVVHFRSSKYEIHTSQAVIDALCGFIDKRGHLLIVNLLYTWIHVHIIDNEVPQWTEDSLFLRAAANGDDNDDDDYDDDDEEEDDDMLEGRFHRHVLQEQSSSQRSSDESAESCIKKEKTNDTDAGGGDDVKLGHVQLSLETLCEAKEQLLKAQTQFPRFIRIAEKCRGLTSAGMDANECHLAAGFNDSVVRLWQMNQQTNRSRNLYQSPADRSCAWELNRCLPEEEDTLEEDVKRHERTAKQTCHGQKYYEGKYEDNSYNEHGGIELRGHGLGVTDVRFSTHYPLLYSISKDSTMRCWRAENYTCAALYRGHRYPIWCMDESSVSMYVATGSKDLTARLWSLEREFPLITYAGHTQDVECIAFHPNGNYIATGSTDLTVRLWCVTSGKLMRVFSDCKQPISSIAFSPDGKLLATGGEETKVRIFDLAAGSQLTELKDYSASVSSLAWSGNGHLLASVCRDGSLRVHESDKMLSSMSNSSSSSSSSLTSSSSQRLLAITSNCQRLVNVFFNQNDTICCIGT